MVFGLQSYTVVLKLGELSAEKHQLTTLSMATFPRRRDCAFLQLEA